MKQDEIRWAVVDREDLIDVLLGEHELPNIGLRMLSEPELRGSRLSIGYKAESQRRLGYAPPSLIVIPDETAI